MPSHIVDPDPAVLLRVQEIFEARQVLGAKLILELLTDLAREGLLAPELPPKPHFRTDDWVYGDNALKPDETVLGRFRGIVGGNKNVLVVTVDDAPRVIKPDTARRATDEGKG